MPDVVIGIDPGLSGGLAVLTLDGDVVDVRVMPVTKVGGKGEIDAAGLAAFVRGVMGTHKVKLAAVELVGSRPGQGSVSGFGFGAGYGMVRGVLATLGIRCVLVRPQEWQKHVLPRAVADEGTKSRSIAYCKTQFPGLSLLMTPRSRKPHDGVGDATAIGEYARRVEIGSVVERPAKPAKKRKPK